MRHNLEDKERVHEYMQKAGIALQQFEVGSFLNLEDKERVHECMQKAGIAVCSNKWW